MLWLWIVVGYLSVASVVGIASARYEAKALIADPEKFRYPKRDDADYDDSQYAHKQKPRSEESRVRRCAETVFWEAWWVGILWPICGAAVLVMGAHTLLTDVIAGKALTEARKKDADRKTAQILKEYEEKQKKEFDGL